MPTAIVFWWLLKISCDISIHFGWACQKAGLWTQGAVNLVTCQTKQFTIRCCCDQQLKTNYPKTVTRTICNTQELGHLQASQSKICTVAPVSFGSIKLPSINLCIFLHLDLAAQATLIVLKQHIKWQKDLQDNQEKSENKFQELLWLHVFWCLIKFLVKI